MLLDKYEQGQLLFNVNFKDKTRQEGVYGYRGELVLVPGEIIDDLGRCKPPLALVRSAVLLEKNGKIQFFVGILDELELIKIFIEKYCEDFADDIKILMYVVNITCPMQTVVYDIPFTLIPLRAGVAWNELIDELAMDKINFKGQSPADKIVTAYEAYKSYIPRYDLVTADDAYVRIADIKRELIGAV